MSTGIYINTIANDPSSFFGDKDKSEGTDTPIELEDRYDYIMSVADKDLMDGIVNILLVGIDYADERESWGDSRQNSDVMMVLAVNFNKNTADMISIPRDAYAKIAKLSNDWVSGYKKSSEIYDEAIGKNGGIMKLNASLYQGGGLPDGLKNVADSIEIILGGIDIDYYMAVTMPVLKEMVDIIGGVQYDMDITFKLDGRTYQKGIQTLDGQAVLDYVRVRKASSMLDADSKNQTTDNHRVNRQKKILIAVFEKLKTTNLIYTVPDIINAMKDKVYTNLSFSQMAAMAAFGSKLDATSIKMHTMWGGDGQVKEVFNYDYAFIDQDYRVELINKIYGVTVKKQYEYSYAYAKWLWAALQGEKYISIVEKILSDNEVAEAEPPESTGASPEPAVTPVPRISAVDRASLQALIADLKTEMNTQDAKSAQSKSGINIATKATALEEKAIAVFNAAGYINSTSSLKGTFYTSSGKEYINWWVTANPR